MLVHLVFFFLSQNNPLKNLLKLVLGGPFWRTRGGGLYVGLVKIASFFSCWSNFDYIYIAIDFFKFLGNLTPFLIKWLLQIACLAIDFKKIWSTPLYDHPKEQMSHATKLRGHRVKYLKEKVNYIPFKKPSANKKLHAPWDGFSSKSYETYHFKNSLLFLLGRTSKFDEKRG